MIERCCEQFGGWNPASSRKPQAILMGPREAYAYQLKILLSEGPNSPIIEKMKKGFLPPYAGFSVRRMKASGIAVIAPICVWDDKQGVYVPKPCQ